MEKVFEILKIRTLYIFFLITVPIGVNYHSTNDLNGTAFFLLLNIFGFIMYFIWFYAVGAKGIEMLKSKNLEIKGFQFFNFLLIANLVIDLFFSFCVTDYFVYRSGGLSITLPQPVSLLLIGVLLMVFIKILVAKLILSIEKNKVVELKDYYKTFILLLIPYIGILFVHYRVREQLAEIKKN